jgi:uncharacterized pyridoxal phosphate-containing UPF0001 family protein
MNVYQDIQSHKMRYLINYVYWTCLFKSIKNNRNANETDWINSHPKQYYVRLNISEILFKNKYFLF